MSKREREERLRRRNEKKRRDEKLDFETSVLQALEMNDIKRAREMLCREIEAKYEDRVKADDSDTCGRCKRIDLERRGLGRRRQRWKHCTFFSASPFTLYTPLDLWWCKN